MLAPTDRQSSKLGLSGLRGGRAANRLSGTNWKRPSNLRSPRRTWVRVRQASRLASSPARGMQSGTAKRWPPSPTMICVFGGGCCAAPGRTLPAAMAARRARRARLGSRLEEGLDRDSVRAIGLGEGTEGRGGEDGALGGIVQQLYAARLRHADRSVLERAVGGDGEGDGDGLGEPALDLARPDEPDLALDSAEVPVAEGVRPVGHAGTGGTDQAHSRSRAAGARPPRGAGRSRALRRRRAGVPRRWERLLRLGLHLLGVRRRQALPRL